MWQNRLKRKPIKNINKSHCKKGKARRKSLRFGAKAVFAVLVKKDSRLGTEIEYWATTMRRRNYVCIPIMVYYTYIVICYSFY